MVAGKKVVEKGSADSTYVEGTRRTGGKTNTYHIILYSIRF